MDNTINPEAQPKTAAELKLPKKPDKKTRLSDALRNNLRRRKEAEKNKDS